MLEALRRGYYRIVKPRSEILSDLLDTPIHTKRVVDFVSGQVEGISYHLETVVNELNDTVSQAIFERVSFGLLSRPYPLWAELAYEENKVPSVSDEGLIEFAEDKLLAWALDHVASRPSYAHKNRKNVLILDGLALPDLPEVCQKEAEHWVTDNYEEQPNWNIYRSCMLHPRMEDTPYEIYLHGLSEERFRGIAQRDAVENDKDPQKHRPGYDWMLDPEKLMFHYGGQLESELPANYYFFKGRLIPVLEVHDVSHGHEAAKDCIRFALTVGKDILEEKASLIRHAPYFRSRESVA